MYKILSSILFFACFSWLVIAHPAYQHHFHKLVKADSCLSECMKIVQESEHEISILKRGNISGFLLDLDEICDTINNASTCMSKCTHEANNPFSLESTKKICEEEARKDVELLEKCLTEKGPLITKTCIDECGDYEKLNDEVHNMTLDMAPNIHDSKKAEKVIEKTNDACKVLKCTSRCSVAEYNEECDSVSDTMDAGDLIKSLIERVLRAQRSDLERLNLADTLAQSVPKECNYMYMPEVFFNETKDELSQIIIDDMKKDAKHDHTQISDNIHLIRHKAHHEISYTLGQLQNRLIQKQFFVLEEQEQNAKKESKKLDLEIALLTHKKAVQDAADNL